MFRKSALALAMWGTLAAQSAFALGLGDIHLKSALNQPLRAEVELLSVTEREMQELRVALASSEAFAQAGIDRPAFLSRLSFEAMRKPDGTAVIQITSRESVREPFLDFMLEVVWSNGKLVRAYTVLVDPPVTMPAPAPVTRAASVAAPVPARVAAPRPAAPAPAADMGTRTGDRYGPTGRNDTLWNIAAKVRPAGVDMQQAMLGLLTANPDAFIGHNINNLKAGYVLRIPDHAEFTAVSTADAAAEVRTQNQEWREGRARPSRVDATAPVPAPAPATTGSRLELTAPAEAESVSGAARAGEGENLDALRRELVLATEAAEVQRAQSEQLESRLQVLEEQIAKMQRLIELKDDQLALLADQAGVDAPADSAAPGGDTPAEATGVDALESELFMDEGAALDEPPALPDEQAAAVPEPEALREPALVPTPREATTPAPAPFEESRSLLDRLLANPLWIGIGVVVLALLALFGLRRRSTAEPEFQESILQEREVRPTRASAPVVEETAPAKPAAESRPRENDSSLLSEFATSDLGAIQNQSEADPLAEADVYLAYGRYQQAEDLIREALESEPEREDFNLKLFEIYAAAQNRPDFDAHAEKVLAGLESQDHPLWQKVAELGRELNPGNPLYQPGGAPAATPTAGLGAGLGVVSEEDNGLDFDLGLDETADDLTSQEPPLDEMDLGTGEEQKTPEVAESNALDFDLGDLDLDGTDEAEAEEEGEGLLSSLDEVATKLDLARAYIDMGDPDGARSILEEVLEEGDQEQQDEARELLGQL